MCWGVGGDVGSLESVGEGVGTAVVLDEGGGGCATIIGGAFWDPNSKTL